MTKIKTRVRNSLTTTEEQEKKFNEMDRLFSEKKEPFPVPASDRREGERRMTVAKVVYDETGDLISQLYKLCGNSPFVIQHDHAGWYVQTQEWVDVGSVAAAKKSNWEPITGIHYDLRVTLEEAIKTLVKKRAIAPPEPTPTMEPIPPSPASLDALERALAASDEQEQVASSEEDTEEDDLDVGDDLQILLGEQVSAEKKNTKGGITSVVAGTLVMKSFSSDTGEEYGVEYKDAGNHKRSIAVKPETVVPVPSKENLRKPTTPEALGEAETISSVASIIAEF